MVKRCGQTVKATEHRLALNCRLFYSKYRKSIKIRQEKGCVFFFPSSKARKLSQREKDRVSKTSRNARKLSQGDKDRVSKTALNQSLHFRPWKIFRQGGNIADCALTKYCFSAKFASIFLYFVLTQYCVGR